MNAGPPGFRGAPITKGLLLGTLGSSVLVQAKMARRRAPLLVRALTHVLAFRAPGELLFGAALLYFYRLFERQWGSAKYGSFLTVACGLAYALEAAAEAALEARWGAGAGAAAAGPFPLIFANLAANFVLLVPPMHHFTVFGLKMTDKAFIYLASIQLLLSSPPRSVIAGGAGLLAGALYRLNVLGMQRFRLPAAVTDFISSTLGRVLTGPGPVQQVFVTPTAAQQQQQQQRQQQQGLGGGYPQHGGRPGGGAAAAAPRAVNPSPEAVQQLVQMGFDENAAAQALRQAGNNVEAALQFLL
ncbi:Ubiquitin-associated (UBA) isoform 1 [Chlorella sorokiniana]|uniref:Ubiquitin-associated (UBA) isoform 1 n=1 Tax=Chlorella sorokiniana TaxID=3076 RepID=A0A2P6TIF3_CHLSO|nr:Ubiquitin-associated (UBA) isoform 1 [Chlorella sorokiniana]|eukprot:PRW34075.1 Ubiquitin-associated (UBA) isoform 1 [Chlorella sorokiniana]